MGMPISNPFIPQQVRDERNGDCPPRTRSSLNKFGMSGMGMPPSNPFILNLLQDGKAKIRSS